MEVNKIKTKIWREEKKYYLKHTNTLTTLLGAKYFLANLFYISRPIPGRNLVCGSNPPGGSFAQPLSRGGWLSFCVFVFLALHDECACRAPAVVTKQYSQP